MGHLQLQQLRKGQKLISTAKSIYHNNRSLLPLCCYHVGFPSGRNQHWYSSTQQESSSKQQEHPHPPCVKMIFDSKTGIAHVVLNRPSKYNCLDYNMFQSIDETIQTLKRKKNLRVVLLRGSGKAFSSGLDVKWLTTGKSDTIDAAGSNSSSGSSIWKIRQRIDALLETTPLSAATTTTTTTTTLTPNLAQKIVYEWRTLPVPVIAIVHGMCYGAGLQLALGADFRYCTPQTKFSVMEGKWGLIPDMCASITLRELVRIDVAKELTMTGKIINGKEAEGIGLVTRCIDADIAIDTTKNNNNNNKNKKDTDETITKHDRDYKEEEDKEYSLLLSYVQTMVEQDLLTKSPDAIAYAKQLYQQTWISASEQQSLQLEAHYQKSLIASWNQMVASSKNMLPKPLQSWIGYSTPPQQPPPPPSSSTSEETPTKGATTTNTADNNNQKS